MFDICQSNILTSLRRSRLRFPFRQDHLYHRCGIQGLVFTFAEMAVLLRACEEQMFQLGVRLLCPRYEISFIMDQLVIIGTGINVDFSCVPTINQELWDAILSYDCERCQQEPRDGRHVFADTVRKSNGETKVFTYREPEHVFPIDYYFHKFLCDKSHGGAERSDPYRLRGGGGPRPMYSSEQTCSPKYLSALPATCWNKQLVTTSFEAAESSDVLKLIGYVETNGSSRPEGTESETVPVNIIFIY